MDFPREGEGQWSFVYTVVGASGEVINTLGFLVADPATYNQATNDDIFDAWGDEIINDACTSDCILVALRTLVGLGGGDVAEFETTGSRVGNQGGDSVEPGVAVLVNKETGLAGRRNTGRMYIPSPPANAVGDDGVLDNTYRLQVVGAVQTFHARALAATPECTPAILHRAIAREAKPAYTLAATDATPLIEMSVQTKIAHQRTRLRD